MAAWHPAWPGFSARGSLPLPLPMAECARLATTPTLRVGELLLERKREFHVSLLNRTLGARVHEPRAGGALAGALPALFAVLDWSWRASGERWLLLESAQGKTTHSVIELIDMPAFARFRAAVGERLGEALPDAPAHITLYVAGDPAGIGLDSQAEFERLRLHPL